MLDERKRLVLRAIIDDYIQTAEPVGSRTIARRHQLGVSSATIRNEMADLEETGFLQQPHISAGRIPSDKGYRFYVDVLMQPQRVSDEESKQVQREVLAHRQEMERLIHATANLLAMLTKSISVVVAPPVESCVLRHLQLVPIDQHTVLVVMVLSPGMVKNTVMPTNQSYSAEELGKLSKLLNDKLKGISYRDLGISLMQEITEQFGDLGKSLLEIISQGLFHKKEEQVQLNGTLYILDQPEFRDVEKVKTFFRLLDNKQILMSLLDESSENSGVVAKIGKENKREDVRDCSIVTATYHMGDEKIGTIGVIGPTRMEYARMFSAVELMADSLSEILTQFIK